MDCYNIDWSCKKVGYSGPRSVRAPKSKLRHEDAGVGDQRYSEVGRLAQLD